MAHKKSDFNIFFSDDQIGFYQQKKASEQPIFGSLELEKGVIVQGHILDPESLLSTLKKIYKQYKIKPKSVKMMLHDQNILIREITVKKESLQRLTIEEYIQTEKGKSLHFPFEKSIISHYVRLETEDSFSVLLFIADENLLNDYHDVFDYLKVKEISFDLPSLALYNFYVEKTKTDIENLMIVSLYDNLFSIKIIENHMPVFNMIEEFEGTDSQYADIIENYVERIANFYRFNIRKGKSSLSKIVLFDLSNEKKVSKIYSSLNTKLEEFDLLVFDLTNLNSMIDDLPKAAFMAYLESLEKAKNKDIAKAIEFKLHRIPRINHFLNYVMALSFAIFTGISLVYIPFYTTNEEIINQTGLNNNLQNQLTILEEEVLIFEDYTQKEIDYSESFDYLDEADASISSKITDLQSFFTEEMELLSFEVSSEDSMITLVISTSDSSIFNGYLLSIYETFGINNETYDLQRWMTN